jgi:hypothetical protein
MVERDSGTSVSLWWMLGTFHTVVLGVALLLLAYPGGGLGSLLSSLSTLSGIALFIALWGTTLFCTRNALAGLDWLSDDAHVMGAFFWRAMRWGAANGMLFLVALIAMQLVSAATTPATRGNFQLGGALFAVLLYGSFGTIFAAAIGAVVGVTLGALDIAALRIARSTTR